MTSNKASTFNPKSFLKNLTTAPGIYQMLSDKSQVLYVGKAKNLKRRVSSYFNRDQTPRIASMVSQIADIQVIVTQSENEALLLENNLIKQYKPRYNILFRDDKSYPFIFLSGKHEPFPRIDIHRGKRNNKDTYYGPYPSGLAVRQTVQLIQRLFKLRTCRNSYFKNRSRACIQYQIKRCSGPCVGHISADDYQQQVRYARMQLEGKNKQLIRQLTHSMEQAASDLAFEEAAMYRDQIQSLEHIQQKQTVVAKSGDVDVIGLALIKQQVCIKVLFIRQGKLIDNHNYQAKCHLGETTQSILQQFIQQYYLGGIKQRDFPREILIPESFEGLELIANALMDMQQRKLTLFIPQRGLKKQWLTMAQDNAEVTLNNYLQRQSSHQHRWQQLQGLLGLDGEAKSMECFDISHSSGEATVASCVVFTPEGPNKSAYRRFNIKGVTPGDDYGAMQQALTRRYQRTLAEQGSLPDILLIDGGKGQLSIAEQVLKELQITQRIHLYSIAKGPGRKAGLETIFIANSQQSVELDPDSAAMHLLQHIRDEAHRFAITGHKLRRDKARTQSALDEIPGVGAKRKQQLLKHFGSLRTIKSLTAQQIAEAPGISLELATKVKDYFSHS